MKITLAGYTIDAEIAAAARRELGDSVTPEVVSAAYARISRSAKGIGALRSEARESVEKARASNERIVFGFGHSSIAEHAVLNFDLAGVSRLAVEEIEHFRLASFTEKSQRYVRLGTDIVLPREVREASLEREFLSLAREMHSSYRRIFAALVAAGEEEGVAREDARYAMPLATATQLGMTVNARELEHMVSRLAARELDESRRIARRLERSASGIAPSIIRHPRPGPYLREEPLVRRGIAAAYRELGRGYSRGGARAGRPGCGVRLVGITPGAETALAAGILFSSAGGSYEKALAAARKLRRAEIESLMAAATALMEPHHAPWREFEAVSMIFEIVCSASCFAQLKRHRMATILAQGYDPALGVSIPPSIEAAGCAGLLRAAAKKGESFSRRNGRKLGPAAEYILTNAHRRRVLFAANLRELYHFSRLRSDASAQWEIRAVSDEMCALARKAMPTFASLLGGKDAISRETTNR